MDYSQLSDFEINKLVAYALGNADVGRPFDEISGTACQFTVFKNSGLNREGEIVMRPMTLTKDFCNNPADAWPIIESERISLLADYEKWGETTAACETDRGGDYIYEYCDKKAFRAAMIVFLQMQDSKHA